MSTASQAQNQPTKMNSLTPQQVATFQRLSRGWVVRKVNLVNLQTMFSEDGQSLLVVPALNWPSVQIGPRGGIVIPLLRSYNETPYEAAMHADELLKHQLELDKTRMMKKLPMRVEDSSRVILRLRKRPTIQKTIEIKKAA